MKLNLNIDLEIAKSMENLAHTKIKVIQKKKGFIKMINFKEIILNILILGTWIKKEIFYKVKIMKNIFIIQKIASNIK